MTRLWAVARGVAWRTLKNVLTNPALFLPTLTFPFLFLIAFAAGLSQVQNVPGFDYRGDYTSFQFVFVLLQSATFGGVFTGFGIARDFEGGFARRLLLASPNRTGIVLGYGLAALARWGITATLLTIVALASGMGIGGNAVEIAALYTLAGLINICGFSWSAGIAMRFRTIQAGPLMQMPAFLVLFFAPVYVPLELISGWLHAVARLNPLTYIIEAGRGLMSGEPIHTALAFGCGLVLVGLFVVWAYRGLRVAEAAG